MDELFNLAAYAKGAIKRGLSANAALDELKSAGLGVRRQDWLALVREVRGALESQATGMDRPSNRRPYRKELLFMTTTTATGFIQYVDVWVKDRDSGEIRPRPYGIRTDDLISHGDAIETAMDRMAQFAEGYNEIVLGATYMATYELVPKGLL